MHAFLTSSFDIIGTGLLIFSPFTTPSHSYSWLIILSIYNTLSRYSAPFKFIKVNHSILILDAVTFANITWLSLYQSQLLENILTSILHCFQFFHCFWNSAPCLFLACFYMLLHSHLTVAITFWNMLYFLNQLFVLHLSIPPLCFCMSYIALTEPTYLFCSLQSMFFVPQLLQTSSSNLPLSQNFSILSANIKVSRFSIFQLQFILSKTFCTHDEYVAMDNSRLYIIINNKSITIWQISEIKLLLLYLHYWSKAINLCFFLWSHYRIVPEIAPIVEYFK